MLEKITIRNELETPLMEFLQSNEFFVDQVTDSILRVNRSGELPVFLNVAEQSIYFEVDLGNISEIVNEELYFKLLDLNTEILPVSLGINSTNSDDPRLVLVESRETANRRPIACRRSNSRKASRVRSALTWAYRSVVWMLR